MHNFFLEPIVILYVVGMLPVVIFCLIDTFKK